MSHRAIRAALTGIVFAVCAAGGAKGQTALERVPGGVRVKVRQTTQTTLITSHYLDVCRGRDECRNAVYALLQALVGTFGSPVAQGFDALDQNNTLRTQDATVYVTDLRMRMDVRDTTMIIRLAADGSGMDYVFLERGKLLMAVPMNQIGSAGPGPMPGSAPGGPFELDLDPTCPPHFDCPRAGIRVRRLNGTRELHGHTTRHYLLQAEASTPRGVPAMVLPGLSVSRNMDAWIATDIDAAQLIRAFYRNQVVMLARVEAHPRIATGLMAFGAAVMELGVPLWSTQTDSISITAVEPDEDIGEKTPIMLETTIDSVLSISTTSVDPSVFEVAGVPPPGGTQSCDCSCGGYAEFQRLGKRKKDELRRDPEAMRKLMCGRECMMKWIQCAQ